MSALAVLAGAVAAGGVIYQALGAWLVRRWMAEAPPATNEPLPPVTLVRTLKPGVPELAAKLNALAAAMQPGDQLVIGAAADSAELAEAAAVQGAHAGREIVLVPCGESAALNPKIAKLMQVDAHCRHERLIVTDSEAVIDRAWLDALRREWQAHGEAVLTTPYRFAGARTWPQRLDAAAVLLGLWPGLALVRRWGRVDFTLGAGVALRRGQLAAAGGWARLADFLADDRELGRALAARGFSIRLVATVATLSCDALSWREWWRHQRRVATTYRVSAPWGFAGTLLTHSATAAVGLLLLPVESGRGLAVAAALAAFGLRGLAAADLARTLRFPLPGLPLALALAGWMESVAWALSWLSARVWWAGRRWVVRPDGRLGTRPDRPTR